ncbi:MAG: RagB/SusD family nutrient uptake outer membrane protein [Flavobacteriaceae bacterium]|nr:MAG: RagB/SusD family nutrient uptake outer membrane protein [Flavobacteriaceae bacterium]
MVVSCVDFDKEPLDSLSNETFWSNKKDVITAVNACYSGWEWGDNIMYLDAATDNAYNQFPWEGYAAIGNGSFTPTDVGVSRFSFTTIRKCNDVLENIGGVEMDETLKNRLIAEVRFLRAYQYFIMTQFYGDIPLVETVLSLDEANLPRTPKLEVIAFVLTELSDAAKLLPKSYSGANVGRITKGAALGLKARTELFEGKFADAAITSQQIIDMGQYNLLSSYVDLFTEDFEDSYEVLFDVQYIENDYSNWLQGAFAPVKDGGWSSVTPTQSLVDAYECIDGKTINDSPTYNVDMPYTHRDPRLAATVVFPGASWEGRFYNSIDENSSDFYERNNASKTGYSSKKYLYPLSSFNDMWNNGLNIMAMRYAEVLLIYAEAKIESNQIDNTVVDALNQIRNRAGMPAVDESVYNSQASLRELVRRERRVELAMEGLRWFDIKRWKIGEEVLSKPVTGSRLGTVNAVTGDVNFSSSEHIQVETRMFSSHNYLWPIPQSEIDINSNLEQNHGY